MNEALAASCVAYAAKMTGSDYILTHPEEFDLRRVHDEELHCAIEYEYARQDASFRARALEYLSKEHRGSTV